MPRKVKVSTEVLELAKETVRRAKTADELRAAQAVVLPILFGISDHAVGQVLGRSRVSVVRMRKEFKQLHAEKGVAARNWGGRRSGYMTVDQEREFLSRFFNHGTQGSAVNAGEIKQAFEVLVGHKVAKTTIYRMLDRHGWRKITPRPHHPKSDAKSQKGFKKTAQNGDSMR